MARVMTEAKAKAEYKPISAVVQTTPQLNDLKQFTALLTESDAKRAEARKVISGTDKLHRAFKDNIGLLVGENNFRYNGYAFKVAKVTHRSVKIDKDHLRDLLIEACNGMEPDNVAAAMEMATPLMAYQAAFSLFGISDDVVEACYNAAITAAEESTPYYSVEVYKYADETDLGMVERIKEDILDEPAAIPEFTPRKFTKEEVVALDKPTPRLVLPAKITPTAPKVLTQTVTGRVASKTPNLSNRPKF